MTPRSKLFAKLVCSLCCVGFNTLIAVIFFVVINFNLAKPELDKIDDEVVRIILVTFVLIGSMLGALILCIPIWFLNQWGVVNSKLYCDMERNETATIV